VLLDIRVLKDEKSERDCHVGVLNTIESARLLPYAACKTPRTASDGAYCHIECAQFRRNQSCTCVAIFGTH
jgi:hypothetical protein